MTHRSCLAGVTVGDGLNVAVVGVLNVSPESFYAGSVRTCGDDLLRAAEAMARAGAAFLDVGAMSTAPYLTGRISEHEEADRLGSAVGLLAGKIEVPISADTSRSVPARAALEAGAGIINDVTGLTGDADLAAVVARAGAGLIAMVSDGPETTSSGVSGRLGHPASGPGDPVGDRLAVVIPELDQGNSHVSLPTVLCLAGWARRQSVDPRSRPDGRCRPSARHRRPGRPGGPAAWSRHHLFAPRPK